MNFIAHSSFQKYFFTLACFNTSWVLSTYFHTFCSISKQFILSTMNCWYVSKMFMKLLLMGWVTKSVFAEFKTTKQVMKNQITIVALLLVRWSIPLVILRTSTPAPTWSPMSSTPMALNPNRISVPPKTSPRPSVPPSLGLPGDSSPSQLRGNSFTQPCLHVTAFILYQNLWLSLPSLHLNQQTAGIMQLQQASCQISSRHNLQISPLLKTLHCIH